MLLPDLQIAQDSTPEKRDWLSPYQLAQLVSKTTKRDMPAQQVYGYCRLGLIKATRVPRDDGRTQWRISNTDAQKFLQKTLAKYGTRN